MIRFIMLFIAPAVIFTFLLHTREMRKLPQQKSLKAELYFVYCWIRYSLITEIICRLRGHDFLSCNFPDEDPLYYCTRCLSVSTSKDKLIPYK